ncbi:MAG: YutD family protein [Liquorilactobacillus nagelii]|uniref:YutD family protein n=1 Tax=Liquorilactobacillus nagelii TaxID=82688 RepID=UPI00242B6B5A|nr:YutD family protein [Liquorilactobacillus nagelii]MCI1634269.1 YutD family protein [Liquorilactobacillus nagelii]MCI1921282.1 YutD family protein [Liquorilactobacillus nagelii]MCI1977290.1 YutD family protein [Liquorilactobacillus nagelii]
MNSEKKERLEAQLAKKAATLKEYASKVEVTGKNELTIDGRPYLLIKNSRDGFQVEKLEERFSQILTKYDYIVGDWGFDQLRLHGFYENDSQRGLPSQSISHLEDYLYEYCNFGCAYFILKNLSVAVPAKKVKKFRRKDNILSKNNKTKEVKKLSVAKKNSFGMGQRVNKKRAKEVSDKQKFEIHQRQDSKKAIKNSKKNVIKQNKQKRQRNFTIRQKNKEN